MEENNMRTQLALLEIYKLEDEFKNKLKKLENKIPASQSKVVIYTNDEDYFNGKSKKIDTIRKFCKKNKFDIVKEYFDTSLVNNYKKKDLTSMLIDAMNGEFNTVVLLNSHDIGESPLINTHIINEIFTKNGIRFIDIQQKVDTNFDETIILYENLALAQLINFMDAEEKKMRSERIKKGKEFKAKMKNK